MNSFCPASRRVHPLFVPELLLNSRSVAKFFYPAAWTSNRNTFKNVSLPTACGIADRLWRSRLAQVELYKKHPNEPWLWREDWAAKRIVLNDTRPKVFFSLFTIGSIFALYVAFRNDQAKQHAGIMSWSMIGTFVVAWIGFNLYMLNRRWRRSELEIKTLPGRLGQEFRGTV